MIAAVYNFNWDLYIYFMNRLYDMVEMT